MSSRNLGRASALLLDPDAATEERRAAVAALYEEQTSLIGLAELDGGERDADGAGSELPSGLAIAPRDAARCFLDVERTSVLLRAAAAAIEEGRARSGGRRVRVLYAGCGPLAPLALLLVPRFPAGAVEFSLLDVHRRSLEAVARLVRHHGAGSHVREYVEADATRYRIPPGRRPDVLVAEALQRALAKEPQVAVVLNLAAQLPPDAALVPESIELRAMLFRPDVEFGGAAGPAERIDLGPVFVLDRATVADAFAPVTVRLPSTVPAGFVPMVRTALTARGEIRLGDSRSGLTQPLPLLDLGVLAGGERIEFRYVRGESPGLVHRIVRSKDRGAG